MNLWQNMWPVIACLGLTTSTTRSMSQTKMRFQQNPPQKSISTKSPLTIWFSTQGYAEKQEKVFTRFLFPPFIHFTSHKLPSFLFEVQGGNTNILKYVLNLHWAPLLCSPKWNWWRTLANKQPHKDPRNTADKPGRNLLRPFSENRGWINDNWIH